MKNYLKFLSRLPKDLRERLLFVVSQIATGDLKGLDVKALLGFENVYRCRVGKLRILFRKGFSEYEILDIGFRGDVYK